MSDDQIFFSLFSNCICVEGAFQSIICDLQMHRYRIIPNILVDVLKDANCMSLSSLKAKHYELISGIDLYFNLLASEGWGQYTSKPNRFPLLPTNWDSPSLITNSIIDFDKNSNYKWRSAINQLSDLGCEALQVRLFYKAKPKIVEQILSHITNSNIPCVEIQIETSLQSEVYFVELLKKYPKLQQLIVSNYLESKSIDLSAIGLGQIFFTTNSICNEDSCGVIDPVRFTMNVKHFIESLNFNSCLNRKICIDKGGNIKNCPSFKFSYGHIDTVSLKEALEAKNFKKAWSINKDKVSICKNCEYRYICTDCRAYTKDNHKYTQPSKCGYNPFKGVWENNNQSNQNEN